MKKIFILTFLFLLIITACEKTEINKAYKRSSGPTYLNVPVKDIADELIDFLHAWYPALLDTVNGGYWTNLDNDFSVMDKQEKMLVTQARGLWTASKAAGIFPEEDLFRQAAEHGYTFLTQKMWDNENGGFIQNFIPEDSQPLREQPKTSYGNAFALYALSEYYKINEDTAVLNWIEKSFTWIEKTAHEPEFLGYYNVIPAKNDQREYTPLGRVNLKDQNSSIHLLEAFTNTYRVWPDTLVKKRLQEILLLIRDRMVNDKVSLNLFFNRDWQPLSHRDSSRSYILKNIYMDHVSFGHDIETAYLLIDGSLALNGVVDGETLAVAKKLIDHSLAKGFDKDFYGLYDKGYYFKNAAGIEIVNSDKVWWSQAEAWHTLALAAKYFPGEKVYSRAFDKMWDYLKEQQIDSENHGWYNKGLDSDPANKDAPKGHQWKGAYHDGRALMQVYLYAGENIDG